jgi:hypothetical protein
VCEKCSEIDLHIARYEGLKGQTTDRVFLAGVAEILKNYQAEKSRSAPPGEVRPPRFLLAFRNSKGAQSIITAPSWHSSVTESVALPPNPRGVSTCPHLEY